MDPSHHLADDIVHSAGHFPVVARDRLAGEILAHRGAVLARVLEFHAVSENQIVVVLGTEIIDEALSVEILLFIQRPRHLVVQGPRIGEFGLFRQNICAGGGPSVVAARVFGGI